MLTKNHYTRIVYYNFLLWVKYLFFTLKGLANYNFQTDRSEIYKLLYWKSDFGAFMETIMYIINVCYIYRHSNTNREQSAHAMQLHIQRWTN